MLNRILTTSLAAIAAALAAGVVQAAPLIFFGENQTPAGNVSGSPLNSRDAFVSSLVGVGSEGFESIALGTTPPLTLTFAGSVGNLQANLTGAGDVANATTDVGGRFNTTSAGRQWLRVSGSFAIDFATPISAFGFYGTDIGDFDGQVTIKLTDTNDVVTNLVVNNTVNGANGSLLFWGFIDTTIAFKKIEFGNTNAGVDFFGFDDMIIGDRQQIRIPEPGTLALVALGLAGLGLVRRRRAA